MRDVLLLLKLDLIARCRFITPFPSYLVSETFQRTSIHKEKEKGIPPNNNE